MTAQPPDSTHPPARLALSFAELAKLADRMGGVTVRIHRVDGSEAEATVLGVDGATLLIQDGETDRIIEVPPDELRAVDISMPRRALEWTVAMVAIPMVVAILAGFARLPWVNLGRGDIYIGFIILAAAGMWLSSIKGLREWVDARMTRWKRVFPPEGG